MKKLGTTLLVISFIAACKKNVDKPAPPVQPPAPAYTLRFSCVKGEWVSYNTNMGPVVFWRCIENRIDTIR